MRLEEYIEAIETPNKIGEERKVNLADLYEHFRQGHFTPKQVLEFYRVRDTPRFIEAVKLFEAGKLFASQRQSYEAWEQHAYSREDKERAADYLSLEDSAQMKHAEGTPANIRLFIMLRIYGARPRQDDMSDKANKIKDKWIADTNRYKWRWNA